MLANLHASVSRLCTFTSSLLSSLRLGRGPNKQGSDKGVYLSCPRSTLTGCSALCPLLLFLLPIWWYFLLLGFSLPGCLYFSLSFPLVLIPHVISTVVSMLMPSASRSHVWAPGHHCWLSLTMAIWPITTSNQHVWNKTSTSQGQGPCWSSIS